MKMNWKKVLCFATLILVFAQIVSLGVWAEDDYVIWELSDDDSTLTDGSRVYEAVNIPNGSFLDSTTEYYYANTVTLQSERESYGDGEVTVCAPETDSEIVWLQGQDGNYIYATQKGQKFLERFADGAGGRFRLRDENWDVAELDFDTVVDLDSLQGNEKTVDVRELGNTERFDVIMYDETDTLAIVYGAVYRVDDGYYYLNYLGLPNQYFDADGNFSYRGGKVTLCKLDQTLFTSVIATASEAERREYEYLWEEDRNDSDDDYFVDYYEEKIGSDTFFWIACVFWGVIVPLAFLVLGTVLACSKKMGYPKHWCVLLPITILWIVAAVILMMMVQH